MDAGCSDYMLALIRWFVEKIGEELHLIWKIFLSIKNIKYLEHTSINIKYKVLGTY